MRPELLAQMAAVQQTHWWFAARRDILSAVIDGLALPAGQPRVLEIGCGPGGNLAMLARHGTLSAMEYAPVMTAWLATMVAIVARITSGACSASGAIRKNGLAVVSGWARTMAPWPR